MNTQTQDSVRRWAKTAVAVLGFSASVYHLYAAYFYPLFALQHRALHFLLLGVMLFLIHTVIKEKELTWPKLIYSLVFIAMTVAGTLYVLVNYDSVAMRAGAYNTTDIAFGILMLLVVFRPAGRGTGWPIVIVAGAFFVYAFVGPYMPLVLAHRGFPLTADGAVSVLDHRGHFRYPAGRVGQVRAVVHFVRQIWSGRAPGSFSLTWPWPSPAARGGPAKAAVLGSAVMGTLSGSSWPT